MPAADPGRIVPSKRSASIRRGPRSPLREWHASTYHMVLFGGTLNKAFDGPHNDLLLAEQRTACETVMTAYYPALGFA